MTHRRPNPEPCDNGGAVAAGVSNQAQRLFLVDEAALSPKELNLARRLEREYTVDLLRDVLLPLIEQTSPVSLRALDWTVVNWSKQHLVVCSSLQTGHMTNVHHCYRQNLAFWKRRLFDPFRRRHRCHFRLDGVEHETTLGQANFALFAYQSGLLAYALSHIDAIETHMNVVSQRHKRARVEAERLGVNRKRSELTSASPSTCIAYTSPMHVDFQ